MGGSADDAAAATAPENSLPFGRSRQATPGYRFGTAGVALVASITRSACGFGRQSALEAAQAEQRLGVMVLAANTPTTAGPVASTLTSGDAFFSEISAGIASPNEVSGSRIGRTLHDAATKFVRKSDVLAKHVISAKGHGGGTPRM